MTFLRSVAVTEWRHQRLLCGITTGDDPHEGGDIIRCHRRPDPGHRESCADSAAQMMEDGSLYVGDAAYAGRRDHRPGSRQ